MEIQSLEIAREAIDRFVKNNPKARLRTLYKNFRQWQSLSYIGDWPLISEIVFRSAKVNKFYTKKELATVCRLSEDPYLQRQRGDSKLVSFLANKDRLKRSVRGD